MKKGRLFTIAAVVFGVVAIMALSIPGSPAYLPELLVGGGVYEGKSTSHWIKALKSSDPAERKEAMKAVASIGPKASEAVPVLAEILTDDPDREMRNEAALTLSKMDPPPVAALSALIRAMEDKEAPVRMNAVNTLFRLGRDAKPAARVLINAMKDEKNLTNVGLFHFNIQDKAALALARATAGTNEGVPALIEYLKRAKEPFTRLAAVRAIAEVGPEARDAEPLLIPLLKDRVSDIREETAIALRKIGAEVPDSDARKKSDGPKGNGKKNKANGVKRDSKDMELAQEEREYLWEIEHHGNILVKHGLGRIADALKNADRNALSRLLADSFTGADQTQVKGVEVASDHMTIERKQGGPQYSVAIPKASFIDRLFAVRKLFATAPPQVKFALMTLSPKLRGKLDGLWEGTAQLRMNGEYPAGAPIEVIVYVRYETVQPTEEKLARPGWLRSAAIEQVQTAKAPKYLFQEVARQRGLDVDRLFDNWSWNSLNPTSGGVYVTDFDRDGFLDVFLTDFNGQFLYRGRPGGKFEDVTVRCGLPAHARVSVAGWIDVDGDGWEDLLSGTQLWRNMAGQRFVNYSGRADLRLPSNARNIVVADYDRDGRLDLYVPLAGSPVFGSWIDGVCEESNQNYLFRNKGDWKFEDVTRASGTDGGRRSSFTAAWLDANNDHWPDLHVINEFGDGVLYINKTDGTFRPQKLANRPADFGSMGLTVGDVNNDGYIDIYCANMYSKAGTRVIGNLRPDAFPPPVLEKMRRFVAGSQLHLSRAGASFEQVGPEMQVAAVGWAYGACLADLDNDGWLDLYGTAGFVSRKRDEPDG